ncbi:DUF1294 domain-containing protein [Roseateles terrae]|uniref:Uncharacterized membrane protein YsdA (DUF1294 family)/cold shock CspA family protein n=1 Tax=Roseateles terrae TaxID=431060 RepID=A0ABR6GPV3_9BURK|nr:cold shock and DUF1294 domain-containing protein [Roseateles terrae]MBB3194151.1 uncharacterized membrane protein YsdA (DUF1294 family)/cold shock CspA family protein [Roseateles terrae]OWQ88007.1 hypothetical protein CDN98_07620 [Roseateles terrae]
MRVEGKVIQWDDAKGYGFIAPSAGGSKIFVHARAFGLRPRRPFVGERVSYEVGLDGQGKSRAIEVRSLEPRPAPAGPAPATAGRRPAGGSAGRPTAARTAAQAGSRGGAGTGRASGTSSASRAGAGTGTASNAELWLIPLFASLVLLTHLAWPLPHALWGGYMAMSLATFIVYALDKRAARLGQWRVKESTLHGLAVLCGWPGALLAQHLLRHKSAKPSFRRLFWLSTALNILLFVLVFTPLLTSLLKSSGVAVV